MVLRRGFEILLAFVVAAPAVAQARGSALTCENLFGPSRVEIQNKNIAENNFNVSRGLKVYSLHFPFKKSAVLQLLVKALAPGSTWVDMGAGRARALNDGLKLNPGLNGVAVSYKQPFDAATGESATGRFKYLDGDYVENMSRDGAFNHLRGRVQLITDLYGPLSYSEEIPELLQVYVDLLAKRGVAYLNIMTERIKILGKNESSIEMMNGVNGSKNGFVAWLKAIPGIEIVERARFVAGGAQSAEISEAIMIRKIADHVEVPRNLMSAEYISGSPPRRVFTTAAPGFDINSAGLQNESASLKARVADWSQRAKDEALRHWRKHRGS